jgi:prevent-host-death family protein
MQTVSISRAKTHFSTLLDQVEKGDQAIITKYGRPIAKLAPYGAVDEGNLLKKKQAIQQLKALAQSHSSDGLDWKKLRDEGKR